MTAVVCMTALLRFWPLKVFTSASPLPSVHAYNCPLPHSSPPGHGCAFNPSDTRILSKFWVNPSKKCSAGCLGLNSSISHVRRPRPHPHRRSDRRSPRFRSKHSRTRRYPKVVRVGRSRGSHSSPADDALARLCAARTGHGTRTHGRKIVQGQFVQHRAPSSTARSRQLWPFRSRVGRWRYLPRTAVDGG